MMKAGLYTFINAILIVILAGMFACEDAEENDSNDNTDNSDNVNIEALSDGDFEEWKVHTEGEVSYEVPASEWWGSLNMLKTLGSPLTMTKTDNAHTGNFAVRLETINWGDELIIPGIIAAGYFDPDQPISENLMLGRPFTQKPDVLRGYFTYDPATQDTAIFYTNLTRYNTETDQRDTIAEADISITDSIPDYQLFEMTYTYYLPGLEPDTINVLFLTSVSGQEFMGHPGSTLSIDDVELVFSNDE
ncbi:MAG: PCMD domain-containing protein [Bacteroidales bacterium]